MADTRADAIRRRAGVLAASQRVQIEVDPLDDTAAPPAAGTVATITAPGSASGAAGASTADPEPPAPPSPASEPPQAERPPVPPSAANLPQSKARGNRTSRAAAEARRIFVMLNDEVAITALDTAQTKLKNARTAQKLKGQLGPTLLLMMGLRLIDELSDDELFTLARDCATYQ